MKSRKVHPAIESIYQEHRKKPSEQLLAYLASFSQAKAMDEAVFIEGVKGFLAHVNSSAADRKVFFGSVYGGLHYENSLADLWNAQGAQMVSAHQISHIAPTEWETSRNDSYKTLIYKGNKPSAALDALLQGPTVIDCGMFCQLAVWFGIRHVLGDDVFNELYGKIPFYLTQILYDPIVSHSEVSAGNPLLTFFKTLNGNEPALSRLVIEHVANDQLYRAKHPGGTSGGQNCVVLDGLYTMFLGTNQETSALERSAVETYLLSEFNLPRDKHDADKLALISANEEILDHDMIRGAMTYREFFRLESLDSFGGMQLTKKKFQARKKADRTLKIEFNFPLFMQHVEKLINLKSNKGLVRYKSLRDERLDIPESFMEIIPHENKHISFESYQINTPMQEKLKNIAKHFCHDIFKKNIPACVIVSGQPGIGKTASAVSAAKELMSRGKKVGWISEVVINNWTEARGSMSEVLSLKKKIAASLTPETDVVFLDDDNLTGFSGEVLLEEIYRWYCTYPNRGLYITSNECITFEKCYGLQLTGEYDSPPFVGYESLAFANMCVFDQLSAQSLRPAVTKQINECSDEEKCWALMNATAEASVGIIISPETFERIKDVIDDKEWVAGTPEGTLDKIRRSLYKGKGLGDRYDALLPEQKRYIHQFQVNGYKTHRIGRNGSNNITIVPPHQGVAERIFKHTNHTVIVVDILEQQYLVVNETRSSIRESLRQLLSVVNFAHDQGGRRVIIVNKTNRPNDELLTMIEHKISEADRERSMARLNQLLFSPALTAAIPSDVMMASADLQNELKIRFGKHRTRDKKHKQPKSVGVSVHQTTPDSSLPLVSAQQRRTAILTCREGMGSSMKASFFQRPGLKKSMHVMLPVRSSKNRK